MGNSGLQKEIVELGWEDLAGKGESRVWIGKSGLAKRE
jgi:hypothetical protein